MTKQEQIGLIKAQIEEAEDKVEAGRRITQKWEALLDLRRNMLELATTKVQTKPRNNEK